MTIDIGIGPFDAAALAAATEAVKRNREFAVSIPGEKYLFVAPEDQAYDTLLAAWEALPRARDFAPDSRGSRLEHGCA